MSHLSWDGARWLPSRHAYGPLSTRKEPHRHGRRGNETRARIRRWAKRAMRQIEARYVSTAGA